MRLLISFAIVGAAAVALIACSSADKASNSRSVTQVTPSSSAPVTRATPGTTAAVPADSVRRITSVELQDLINKGQAFVVDVRNQASYDAGHIRGARLIPNSQILNHVKELPRDKTIVTYCS